MRWAQVHRVLIVLLYPGYTGAAATSQVVPYDSSEAARVAVAKLEQEENIHAVLLDD